MTNLRCNPSASLAKVGTRSLYTNIFQSKGKQDILDYIYYSELYFDTRDNLLPF